jgi:hypothetical protein
MARVASKLTPATRGGFIARKVIPADVREDYAKLYGQRTEERLNTGAMPILLAASGMVDRDRGAHCEHSHLPQW